MSKYTPSSPYTEPEFEDMLQCYLDSGKKIKLAQMYYSYRYPSRRKPKLYTLEKVVQNYLKTLASSSVDDVDEDVTKSASGKDNRIIKYFKNNSHASVKKAASIFSLPSSYIEKLLEERKAEINPKRNKDGKNNKQMSLNDFLNVQKKIINPASIECKEEKIYTSEEREEITIEELVKTENLECEIKTEIEEGNEESAFNEFLLVKKELEIENEVANEVFMSEPTLDDAVRIETYVNVPTNTKKRKFKIQKPDDNKKLKTTVTDLNEWETSHLYSSIVYTTRLEEMNILRQKLKNVSVEYVRDEILRESRPKFNYFSHRSNSKVRKTMCFKLLKQLLSKLNKKNRHIHLIDENETTDNNSLKTNVEECSNTDISDKVDTYNVEDGNVMELIKNGNLVIIINNVHLKLRDVYVMDFKGNVVEYYCVKSEDESIINDIEPSKNRLVMDACCWFYRKFKTDTLWPPHEWSSSRFLTTRHKCIPDQCKCCCRPKDLQTETMKLKSNESNLFKATIFDKNQSLISKASTYCYEKSIPENIEQNNDLFDVRNSLTKTFVFTETKDRDSARTCKKEYYEITKTHNVLFYAVVSTPVSRFVRDLRSMVLSTIFNDCPSANTSKIQVCCKWQRDSYLLSEYKDRNLSVNALRFLKKPIYPSVCDICKGKQVCKDKNISLDVNMPSIEHTRNIAKSTLLKFGYKGKNTHKEKGSATETARWQLVLTMAANEKSKIDQLVITCKEIPAIEITITNVEHQIATAIVTKLTDMGFCIKEDGKVIASVNSPMQTTSTKEFQILAYILQNIQKHLKVEVLPPGTAINLVAKIKVANNTMLQSNAAPNATKVNYSDFKARGRDTKNWKNKQSVTSTKNTKDLFCYEANNYLNSNSGVNQNKAGMTVNTTDRDSMLKNLLQNKPATISEKFTPDLNKSFKGIELRNKSDTYDCFAQLISCSKKCYADSFQSYLKIKKNFNDNPAVPQISSLIQSSNSATESLPSTSETADALSMNNLEVKDTSYRCNPATSTADNDNINTEKSEDASVSLIKPSNQEILLFDPETNQIVRLAPNITNSLGNITDVQVGSIKQIVLNKNDDSIEVLTPINQSNNVSSQAIKLNVMPDIINDIPNNSERDECVCEIVVKEEIDLVLLE